MCAFCEDETNSQEIHFKNGDYLDLRSGIVTCRDGSDYFAPVLQGLMIETLAGAGIDKLETFVNGEG